MKTVHPTTFPVTNRVIPTSNGGYPILYWEDGIDEEFLGKLERGRVLTSYFAFELCKTPYGSLPWLVACVGTARDFADQTTELPWFYFIPDPGNINQEDLQWFHLLEKEPTLHLGISIKGEIHMNRLVGGQLLKDCIEKVKEGIKNWHIGCDYLAAKEWLWDNHLNEFMEESRNHMSEVYGEKDGHLVLLDSLGQDLIIALEKEHFLCQLYQNNQLGEYVQEWRKNISLDKLKEQSQETAENLLRDWLFASICYDYSQKVGSPKIAIGSADETWIWSDLPYQMDSVGSLHLLSKAYRYLLGRNWRRFLRRNDALSSSLNLPSISHLGRVPQRSSFSQLSKILQGAALDRAFPLLQPTAIIIGKKGLEEIEYFPLSADGLRCVFKVTLGLSLLAPDTNPINLVIVGELDAVAGKIKAVGTEDSPPLRLILFLVAIAYRDIVVARESATSSTASKRAMGGKKPPKLRCRNSSIKLVARIKRNKSQIHENFADPQQLVKSTQKYSSYLRSCHPRRLHEGWKASEKALKMAEQYQWLVPEGHTFVQPAVVGDGDLKLREEFKSISLMNLLFDN